MILEIRYRDGQLNNGHNFSGCKLSTALILPSFVVELGVVNPGGTQLSFWYIGVRPEGTKMGA